MNKNEIEDDKGLQDLLETYFPDDDIEENYSVESDKNSKELDFIEKPPEKEMTTQEQIERFEYDLQQLNGDNGKGKWTKKNFENATVTIDKNNSCIKIITENGKPHFYYYKTKEDQEYLHSKDTRTATMLTGFVLASLSLSLAIIGAHSLFKGVSLSGFLIIALGSIICSPIIAYFLYIGIIALAHGLDFGGSIRNGKRIKPFLITALAWLLVLYIIYIKV